MRRFLISVSGGIAITALPALVGALILNRGVGIEFILLLLFGPQFLIERLGVGPACADANLIREKLDCLSLAIMIDLFAYPLIISACSYLVYVILFRHKSK